MRAVTSGWTERHSVVAALTLLALAGCFVGLSEGPPVVYVVTAALALTAVLGLALDVWGGMLVGLGVAAAMVLVRRTTGHWSEDVFAQALLETLTILSVGALAGHTGGVLRRGGHEAPATSSPFDPAYGSLGLLGGDAARTRLSEEIERGERRQQPVVLMMLDAVVTDDALPPAGRTAALRAVARIVESRAQQHDIPFALAADRFGIVFPETTVSAVWDTIGRIMESTAKANVAYGTERQPRPLADVVDVHAGISQQSRARSTADALLDDALDALERARREEVGP